MSEVTLPLYMVQIWTLESSSTKTTRSENTSSLLTELRARDMLSAIDCIKSNIIVTSLSVVRWILRLIYYA